MPFFNYYNYNKNFFINCFIAIIPLSLILGNLATNINIILIILLGLSMFGKNTFIINEKIYSYLIFFFFVYLIFTTIFNNWPFLDNDDIYKENLIKSLSYLRFLVFFLVINKLIERGEFNIKLFLTSCAFFSLIISLDITIQFFFKTNILGLNFNSNKPSSFFGNEQIAGGFLQKFSLIFIFFILSKKKFKNENFFLILLFLIFLLPIIFTGNRMPMIIYIMSIFLYFIVEKKLKEIFITFLICFIIIFSFVKIPLNQRLQIDLRVFFIESVKIIKQAPRLFLYNEGESVQFGSTGYLIHFNTGVQIWKKNMVFGHGLKSFKLNCSYENFQTCNTHPHNYFIELLVDTGLIGIVVIYTMFFVSLKNFIKFYYTQNKKIKLISIVFFLLLFFEFFPIRSTGSFFTTNNSTFIFLIFAIFLNLKNLRNHIK